MVGNNWRSDESPRDRGLGGVAQLLLKPPNMKTNPAQAASHAPLASVADGSTVVVVGGNGGLSSRYREIVEEQGMTLRHYEKRIPAGARRSGNAALIIVIITMVSHALCQQARELADTNTQIVYLKSPSLSALRSVFTETAKPG